MRLVAELAAGAAACAVAFYLARPDIGPRESDTRAMQRTSDRRGERPRTDGAAPSRPSTVSRSEPSDAAPSLELDSAMTMLRSAAIVETARDMQSRGQDVVACLDGARPVGVQKLRFAVEVASTAAEATLGRWRFVEVADGEPVPPSFAECAARALGGGQRLVPQAGFRFPDHRGELSIVYTIPAPAAE